jgi:hypothetical protein
MPQIAKLTTKPPMMTAMTPRPSQVEEALWIPRSMLAFFPDHDDG